MAINQALGTLATMVIPKTVSKMVSKIKAIVIVIIIVTIKCDRTANII